MNEIDRLGDTPTEICVESDALPFSELRRRGVLWAINRYLFHPRGYALALEYSEGSDPERDEPSGWSIVAASPGHTEPFRYAASVDEDRLFQEFEDLLDEVQSAASYEGRE